MNENKELYMTARLIGEDNTKKQLMFSLITGEFYEIESDELKNMDQYQIPLIKKPSQSCKKCYGRMHNGFNITLKIYSLCSRCVRKYVDFKLLPNESIKVDTIKYA